MASSTDLESLFIPLCPAIRILELKSTEQMPSTLYESYEAQLYGQVGLMDRLWNQPAFGQRTFPELCRERFNIIMPHDPADVDMEAWVLCVSMSDAKAYGPYLPDASILDLCLKTAGTLWNQMKDCRSGSLSLNDVYYAKGFYGLCSYCDWNADCPKFTDSKCYPELQPDIERLAELKETRNRLDAEIENIESGLKTIYACSAANGGWLNTETHRFRVSEQAGRRSLNRERLLTEFLRLTHSEDETNSIVASCETEGKPFSRLTVSKIKEEYTIAENG